MRILPLAEVKTKLSQLVADVAATDEEVTITKMAMPLPSL